MAKVAIINILCEEISLMENLDFIIDYYDEYIAQRGGPLDPSEETFTKPFLKRLKDLKELYGLYEDEGRTDLEEDYYALGDSLIDIEDRVKYSFYNYSLEELEARRRVTDTFTERFCYGGLEHSGKRFRRYLNESIQLSEEIGKRKALCKKQ